MPLLPTFADRLWYAHHCLPRDHNGKPPTQRHLEAVYKLPAGILSKIALGKRTGSALPWETMEGLGRALRCSPHWLQNGGETHLVPSGFVPPRPRQKWNRHGEVTGWDEAVSVAMADAKQKVPPEAFLAAAQMPLYIPTDRITPAMAIAAASYCWEFSTPAEQEKYSTGQAKGASSGHRAHNLRKRNK